IARPRHHVARADAALGDTLRSSRLRRELVADPICADRSANEQRDQHLVFGLRWVRASSGLALVGHRPRGARSGFAGRFVRALEDANLQDLLAGRTGDLPDHRKGEVVAPDLIDPTTAFGRAARVLL